MIVIALIDRVHTEQMFARGIFAQDLRLVTIHLDLLNIMRDDATVIFLSAINALKDLEMYSLLVSASLVYSKLTQYGLRCS